MSATTGSNFPFIISVGPNVPRDARTVIRKQAMKDIGLARRKKGNYGQTNRRQFPLYLPDQCTGARNNDSVHAAIPMRLLVKIGGGGRGGSKVSAAHGPALPETTEVDIDLTLLDDDVPGGETAVSRTISHPTDLTSTFKLIWSSTITLSDYERVRSKFGVEITDLSTLTHFEVAKSTSALLSLDPSCMTSLTGHYQWSFLDYVPARYGRTACLTAATNAYLARIQMAQAPNAGSATVCNQLYGVALHALQDALGNESTAMEADVLCATQLLGLHELLDPSRDMAWGQHLRGSVQLYKHRCPSRFTTEFEKALLAAHVGAIVFETVVSGTRCYLEEPEWMELYTSLAQESNSPFLTARSSLAINLRASHFVVPGLWHDVCIAVNSPEYLTNASFGSLESRCRKTQSDLTDSFEAYKAHCLRPSLTELPATELDLRRDLFGTVRGCLGTVNCLLATICVDERHKWMAEARELAHLGFDLQKQAAPRYSWLFSDHENGVASVVLLTTDRGKEDPSDGSPRAIKLASRARFNVWRDAIQARGTWTTARKATTGGCFFPHPGSEQ
ncbi:hypothetical protein LTR08_004623 [Meristemomyces frigidus]|nr:hypothetical protein LTR08_004623 [Meristemomyces frigidus]